MVGNYLSEEATSGRSAMRRLTFEAGRRRKGVQRISWGMIWGNGVLSSYTRDLCLLPGCWGAVERAETGTSGEQEVDERRNTEGGSFTIRAGHFSPPLSGAMLLDCGERVSPGSSSPRIISLSPRISCNPTLGWCAPRFLRHGLIQSLRPELITPDDRSVFAHHIPQGLVSKGDTLLGKPLKALAESVGTKYKEYSIENPVQRWGSFGKVENSYSTCTVQQARIYVREAQCVINLQDFCIDMNASFCAFLWVYKAPLRGGM